MSLPDELQRLLDRLKVYVERNPSVLSKISDALSVSTIQAPTLGDRTIASVRSVRVERAPQTVVATCGVGLPSTADAIEVGRALKNALPQRMARDTLWLSQEDHPYFCMIDRESQLMIINGETSEPNDREEDVIVQDYNSITEALRQIQSNSNNWPTYWFASLIDRKRAYYDKIPRVYTYSQGSKTYPVSTLLTAGERGQARAKALVASNDAINSVSGYMFELWHRDFTDDDDWQSVYMANIKTFGTLTLGKLHEIFVISQTEPKATVDAALGRFRDAYCDTVDKFLLFGWAVTGMVPIGWPSDALLPNSTGSWRKSFRTIVDPNQYNTTDLEMQCMRYDARSDVRSDKWPLLVGCSPHLMLLRDYTERLDTGNFFIQRKHDGARATLHVWGPGKCWVYSKNGNRYFNATWNAYVISLMAQLELTVMDPFKITNCILDGELVTFDANDKEMGLGAAIYNPTHVAKIRFIAFDALMINGADIRTKAATERLKMLGELLRRAKGSDWITVSEEIDVGSTNPQDLAKKNKWEGLVYKDKDAQYTAGRTHTSAYRWKLRRLKYVKTKDTDNPNVRKLETDLADVYVLAKQENVLIDFNTGQEVESDTTREFFEQVTLADIESLNRHYKLYGNPADIIDTDKEYPHAEVIVRYSETIRDKLRTNNYIVADDLNSSNLIVIPAFVARLCDAEVEPLLPSLKKDRTLRASEAYICWTGRQLNSTTNIARLKLNESAACIKLLNSQTVEANITSLCNEGSRVFVNGQDPGPRFNCTYNSNTHTITALQPVSENVEMTYEAFSIVMLPKASSLLDVD